MSGKRQKDASRRKNSGKRSASPHTLPTSSHNAAHHKPAPFPSRRQSTLPGLRKAFYPAWLRDLIDVDYADKLGEKDRVWLAAFLEEHYKGWRLKGETQVHSLEHLREAGARYQNSRRKRDPLSWSPRKTLEDHDGTSTTETELVDALDERRRRAASGER